MMSASEMSRMIRAKKKKMEDEKEAVKLSGIPKDAQEIDHIKRMEAGEKLSENESADRNEDPALESQSAEEQEQPTPETASPDPHEEILAKYKGMKVKKMAEGGDATTDDDDDDSQKTIGQIIHYPGMAKGGEVDAEKKTKMAKLRKSYMKAMNR